MNNFPYNKRFLEQQPSFLPVYVVSSSSMSAHPVAYNNQLAKYGINYGLLMYSNRLDKQYPYQQKWNYWNQQADRTPLSIYAGSFPINYTTETIYLSKRQTPFMEYSDVNSLDLTRFGRREVLNYGNPLNIRYFNWFNSNVANMDYSTRLPLKIRAIFVPTRSLPVQQLYVGPLSMPPFLFNHMPQPCCSLPLPPPLPQNALLYAGNHFQQLHMPGYVNQIPVLSYNLNWSMSQPMISPYPFIVPQQQQHLMPISNFPVYQPPLIRDNMPIYPLPMASSSSIVSQGSQLPQYYNTVHPSTCRACIPTPPSSNNSATNNSWIQYCAACYQIPSDSTNSNLRRTNERMTPLLRPSSVLPNVHNQSGEQYQYPYINSRSHRTPPLPPGAILIFDEYIDKKALVQQQFNSKTNQNRPQHMHRMIETSIKIPMDDIHINVPNKHRPISRLTQTASDITSHQLSLRSKSIPSTRSAYSLSTNETVNQRKKILNLKNRKQYIDDEELSVDVPIRNRYRSNQRRNVPSVHYSDHVVNIHKKESTSSNSDALRDLRLSLATSDHEIDKLSSLASNSIKDDERSTQKTNQSIRATSTTPSQSKQSTIGSSATSKTLANTSTITKTNTYEPSNTNTDKNTDATSVITSTKTDKQTGRHLSTTELF